jgi:fatty-acyl-CoA synthase
VSSGRIDAEASRVASALTVGSLFRDRAARHKGRVALESGGRRFSYGELNDRVNHLAHVLATYGIVRGERVAILSENRVEYVELYLAAAKLGAVVACQNWRQSDAELTFCLALSGARLAFVSERYAPAMARIKHNIPDTILLGTEYETRLARASAVEPPNASEPEDGLVILYTSGTTGYPKGALISHRAMIARTMLSRADGSLYPDRGYICWSPLFHMASTDSVLGMLISGGKIIVVDGFNAEVLVETLAREEVGVLTLMPGTLDAVIDELVRTGLRPKGIKAVGSLVDLVPPDKIAEITNLLQAPYRNTFGSTETGLAPASRGRIPIGVKPTRLSKLQSSYCQIRLVDENDQDVPDGEPGEVAMRGPSLFSGYWEAPEANAEAFRGGWYHMGDVLVRNPDGTLDFVDRRKYLIKSGGENIYPAEIERVLLASPRIAEAVIVRKSHSKWGEVPVAFIVRHDDTLTSDDITGMCRAHLAGYKVPKEVIFIADADLPRNLTGKIKRHELELQLNQQE